MRQDEPVRVAARSVAVLPPCDAAGRPLAGDTGDAQGLGELLTAAAHAALARNGFAMVDPGTVAAALKGRSAASASEAGELAHASGLADAAPFIRLDRWVPVPEQTMRIDAVLVELDVSLVDAATQTILWHRHRPLQPVRIYGSLILGQGYIVAADSVMTETLAPLRPAA